jgi:hypothetical protein
MIKSKAQLLRSLAVLSATVLFSGTGLASTVFENTQNLLRSGGAIRTYSPGNNVEFGDQVFLEGSDRRITDFRFDYFLSTGTSGNELGELFFYQNNGTNGTPGALLYRSGEFSLSSGFQSVAAQGLSVGVPSTFTWSVVFKGIDAGEQSGLLLADPPTIGSSLDDFWIKNTDGSWSTFLIDGGTTPANFVARITAVPEPSTYALAVLGGLALAYAGYRRRAVQS